MNLTLAAVILVLSIDASPLHVVPHVDMASCINTRNDILAMLNKARLKAEEKGKTVALGCVPVFDVVSTSGKSVPENKRNF